MKTIDIVLDSLVQSQMLLLVSDNGSLYESEQHILNNVKLSIDKTIAKISEKYNSLPETNLEMADKLAVSAHELIKDSQ